ncbi:MAG TPA: response regulator transcription factor [Gaiellaceae bacterium]|nr:response regulator transcription factor [Gaiellaceae bacterium]
MIRVLLADDQALVRGGFRLILDAQEGIEVVGEADDGKAAVERARELRPDVVLMDVRMPVLDGIGATARVVGEGLAAHVLVLTTFDEDRIVYDALKAGASGFLLKTAPPTQLVEAVRTVAAGEALLAPTLTRRLIEDFVRRPAPGGAVPDRLAGLTEREREVLALIARGNANAEIASTLFLSGATVKTHVNRIFQKLGLRDRVQAVVLAYETGLVRPGE